LKNRRTKIKLIWPSGSPLPIPVTVFLIVCFRTKKWKQTDGAPWATRAPRTSWEDWTGWKKWKAWENWTKRYMKECGYGKQFNNGKNFINLKSVQYRN